MTPGRCALVVLASVLATACGRPLTPEPLEVGRDACAYCRMTVSQAGFASQLLAPGELPKFFDDLGCLSHFLTGAQEIPEGAVIYVADHRTREWAPAELAVFSRVPMLATPMSSHLVAHASVTSKAADPSAIGGSSVPIGDVVPVAWQAGRGR